MPYLFDHLDAIRQVLTLLPFGLITDVDGTISEIASCPEEARVSPICREQLATLTKRLELVAAISGRPALDAKEMIGVGGMVYVGNHGLEQWHDGVLQFFEGVKEYTSKVTAALDELMGSLTVEGISFENKGVALSVHYRRSPDRESARNCILEKIAASSIARDFRVQEGKMVIELCPLVEIDKGVAVKALIKEYHLRGGIYLGDDISDVDAFGAMHQEASGQAFRQALRTKYRPIYRTLAKRRSPQGGQGERNRYRPASFKGLAVGVISEETPQQLEKEADFTLDGVGDVERFLTWLAGVAPAPTRPHP